MKMKKLILGLLIALCLVAHPANAVGPAKNVLGVGMINAGSTNISTSAYSQFIAATAIPASGSLLVCYNSTTQLFNVGYGSSGSEVFQFYLPPASTAPFIAPIAIPGLTRVALEAVGTAATTGLVACDVLR